MTVLGGQNWTLISPKRGSFLHADLHNEAALKKAHEEYEKFRQKMLSKPSKVEEDFIEAEKEFKQIESMSKGRREKP